MDTTEKYLIVVLTLLFVLGYLLADCNGARTEKDTQTVGLARLTYFVGSRADERLNIADLYPGHENTKRTQCLRHL